MLSTSNCNWLMVHTNYQFWYITKYIRYEISNSLLEEPIKKISLKDFFFLTQFFIVYKLGCIKFTSVWNFWTALWFSYVVRSKIIPNQVSWKSDNFKRSHEARFVCYFFERGDFLKKIQNRSILIFLFLKLHKIIFQETL